MIIVVKDGIRVTQDYSEGVLSITIESPNTNLPALHFSAHETHELMMILQYVLGAMS